MTVRCGNNHGLMLVTVPWLGAVTKRRWRLYFAWTCLHIKDWQNCPHVCLRYLSSLIPSLVSVLPSVVQVTLHLHDSCCMISLAWVFSALSVFMVTYSWGWALFYLDYKTGWLGYCSQFASMVESYFHTVHSVVDKFSSAIDQDSAKLHSTSVAWWLEDCWDATWIGMGCMGHAAPMGGGEVHTVFWWCNLRKRDHMED